MATGDSSDIQSRLQSNLPPWFPTFGLAPIIDGILAGIAATYTFIYSLYAFAILQTRISTATGAWLDLIAFDFFGSDLTRYAGEQDPAFNIRILQSLVQPKVTRGSIQSAIETLTGYPVRVIEPFQLTDVGFWKMRGSGITPVSFYRVDNTSNPARWSSRGQSYRFFIECTLPLTQPLGNNAMPAYGKRGDGVTVYSANWMMRGTTAARQWGSSWLSRGDTAALSSSTVLYALVNSLRAAGITAWVKLVQAPTTVVWDQPGVQWDTPGLTWDE